ncbi:MAG: hypothetical protein WC117_10495 [Sphaerochaetaceae bacterium]
MKYRQILLISILFLVIIGGSASASSETPVFKFAVLSDIHAGVGDWQAQLNDTISSLNSESLDYIVLNGDNINGGYEATEDMKNEMLNLKTNYLDRLSAPYHYGVGNHDCYLSPNFVINNSEFYDIWGYYTDSTDVKGAYAFIYCNMSADRKCANIPYLNQQLDIYRDKKVFVVMHGSQIGLVEESVKYPAFAQAISNHNNVVAVLNGHDHNEDGVVLAYDGVYNCWDGRVGDNWGLNYYGYRIFEIYDDGQILTYQYSVNPSNIVNMNITTPVTHSIHSGTKIYDGHRINNSVSTDGEVTYSPRYAYPEIDSEVKMDVMPDSGIVDISICDWNIDGNYSKTWIESETKSSANVTHIVGDFPTNCPILIYVDDELYTTVISNSTGYAEWSYSGGYSDHIFSMIPEYTVLPGAFTGVSTVNFINQTSNTIDLGYSYNGSQVSSITINNSISGIDFFRADDVPGTIRVQDDTNISILDINEGNNSSVMYPRDMMDRNQFTYNFSNNSFTEEFILQNNADKNSPTVIDACDETTGWTMSGATGVISSVDGKIKVVGTTSETGFFQIYKSINPGLSDKSFIGCTVNSNISSNLYFSLYTNTGSKKWHGARFKLIPDDDNSFILPINAPVLDAGQNPAEIGASWTPVSVSKIYVGVQGAPANTPIEIYIDDIFSDVGKEAIVEFDSPDNLSVTSCLLESWNNDTGTYDIYTIYSAENGYIENTTNSNVLKMSDGTLWGDVYGSGTGIDFYGKGKNNETVSGAIGSITYSSNAGSIENIGIRFDLPPNHGTTKFNQGRFRFTVYGSLPKVTYNISQEQIELNYISNNNLIYMDDSNQSINIDFGVIGLNKTRWNNNNPINLEYNSDMFSELSVYNQETPYIYGAEVPNTTWVYSPCLYIGYIEDAGYINETVDYINASDGVYTLRLFFNPSLTYLPGGILNYRTTNETLVGTNNVYNLSVSSTDTSASALYNYSSGNFAITHGMLQRGNTYDYTVTQNYSYRPTVIDDKQISSNFAQYFNSIFNRFYRIIFQLPMRLI